jgi:L-fuconolactonase
MFIYDSHVHSAANWYEPLATLLYQLDTNGVERALLVQQMGQFDNTYILDSVRSHPDRLAAVVMVDVTLPDAPATLARWAAAGAAGVRLRPTDRSPGDDPMAIWRQAATLGLPISCAGSAAAFADAAFAAVVEAIPTTPLVIEHLGSINVPDGEAAPYPLRQAVLGLARYPQVAIKFHGLGEICPRLQPFPQPFPFDRSYLALFDAALAAFGAGRMMWGSDFPPVSGREGYANALRWPQAHFADRPAADQAALFGGTAQRIFGRQPAL